nr:tetratricopeptide repeat protein [Pseudomonas otitidis]
MLFASGAVVAQAAPVSIEVLSAVVKDEKIAGAEVLLQKNGAQTVTGRTDAQGRVTLDSSFADDPESLVIVKKDGYSNLVAKCPCTGMTYAISPVMKDLDGLRIVLSWGEKPEDLDSHIAYPGNHIYFAEKEGTDADLDVDDTDSYGPETITLHKKRYGETYVYAVHDFTNRDNPSSKALAGSQAKVFVYVGQSLVRTYYVPKEQRGNLWKVFRITASGDFQDINTLEGSQAKDAAYVLGDIEPLLNEGRSVAAQAASQAAQGDAKALNRKGEAAYHDGKLDEAIDFYRQAIELDANYGQAYSNLGLAYQKANRTAEAIWANRKAIALASGANAATVRASSYYNIARIYEAAEQYDDALRHYHLAKEQKANPVYDKAIQRVQDRH